MTVLRSVLLIGFALASAIPAIAQDYRDAPSTGYYDAQRAGYGYDPRGSNVRSISEFEAPLARYGHWVPSRYGRAWAPNVGRDWRPYTIGRWEQTEDYGRLWQSDEGRCAATAAAAVLVSIAGTGRRATWLSLRQ